MGATNLTAAQVREQAVLPAAEVIRRMVAQAHDIITGRSLQLCQGQTASRVAPSGGVFSA